MSELDREREVKQEQIGGLSLDLGINEDVFVDELNAIKRYKCTRCDHVSSKKSNLESHMKTVHYITESEKDQDHGEVHQESSKPATFAQHLQAEEVVWAARDRDRKGGKRKVEENRNNTYQCSKCHYESSFQASIKDHIKSAHQYSCYEYSVENQFCIYISN